jgi:hypothetical protein
MQRTLLASNTISLDLLATVDCPRDCTRLNDDVTEVYNACGMIDTIGEDLLMLYSQHVPKLNDQ